MTSEAQRIAIALALNWRFVKRLDMGLRNAWWLEPQHQWSKYTAEFQKSNVTDQRPEDWPDDFIGNVFGGKLPDWPEDLNSCHDMEDALHRNFEDAERFAYFLSRIVSKTKHSGIGINFATINATAAQRCEAFLRTKGLWKE